VKIGKQCLQTASAPRDSLSGLRPWTLLGDFLPQTRWAI